MCRWAELIHPDDLPRFEELGAIANFQPLWAYAEEYITELTIPFIGEDTPVLLPDERIDLESALVAFTLNAAYLNKHEDETGSIEVGKLADLIVIDRNVFEIDPADISETQVLLTLFEGRPVHGDLNGL